MLAPLGAPPAGAATLNDAVDALLAQPEVRIKMLALDGDISPNTPEQAAACMRRKADKWARVVARSGSRAD